MDAKEYLRKNGIQDRVINREDLSEYWKSISQLMEEYYQSKLSQHDVIDSICHSPTCKNEIAKWSSLYCEKHYNR